MAKPTSIFKKKAEEPSHPSKGRGALGDALEELEAEEKSDKSKKLFRETSRPEDELLELFMEAPKPKVEIAQPALRRPVERPVKLNIREEALRNEEAQPPVRIQRTLAPPPELRPVPVAAQPQPAAPVQQPAPAATAAELPEDAIYEMIKSQDFSRKAPAQIHAPIKPVERRAHVVQRVLRAPPPLQKPAEKIVVGAPLMEEPILVPAVSAQPVRMERKLQAGMPILMDIRRDPMTLTLLMRWVEFLLERVTREKFSLVIDYYVEIGWISGNVRSQVLAYARGEMQDITKYMGGEEDISDESPDLKVTSAAVYKKVDDWRLSADDHLKSMLFISKMAGIEVDRDKLNSLEQQIKRFKENLEGYYGV